MEYKVIKEFGSAKKGDILAEGDGMFYFDITEGNTTRTMAIDENSVNNLVDRGYIAEVKDDTDKKKLDAVRETVSALMEKYDMANKEVAEAYENKEIPTCVKVEADTVYYNMNKILKKIKDIIDE